MIIMMIASLMAAQLVPDFSSTLPGFTPSTLANMNGEYPLSATPGGTLGMMPKDFKSYPGGVESFDVLSPVGPG